MGERSVAFWRQLWGAFRLQERLRLLDDVEVGHVPPGLTRHHIDDLLAEAPDDIRFHVSRGAGESFANTLPLLHPRGYLQVQDIFVSSMDEYRQAFKGPGQAGRFVGGLGQRRTSARRRRARRIRCSLCAVSVPGRIEDQHPVHDSAAMTVPVSGLSRPADLERPMRRSDDRILTTHVGSVVRPQALLQFSAAARQEPSGAYRDGFAELRRRRGRDAAERRPRHRQRRRIRQIELGQLRARRVERLRAASGPTAPAYVARPRSRPLRRVHGQGISARRSRVAGRCVRRRRSTTQIAGSIRRDADNLKTALAGVDGRGGFLHRRRTGERRLRRVQRALRQRA